MNEMQDKHVIMDYWKPSVADALRKNAFETLLATEILNEINIS